MVYLKRESLPRESCCEEVVKSRILIDLLQGMGLQSLKRSRLPTLEDGWPRGCLDYDQIIII